MLRRKEYKWIRKWMALSLCIGFSLSGCGKQAETVTDYGNTSDSAQNGTEISSQKQDNPGLVMINIYQNNWGERSYYGTIHFPAERFLSR